MLASFGNSILSEIPDASMPASVQQIDSSIKEVQDELKHFKARCATRTVFGIVVRGYLGS